MTARLPGRRPLSRHPARRLPVPGPPARPFRLPPPPRRIALVIGNSAYAAVPRRPNPQRDAKAVADTLRRAGFDEVTEASDLSRTGMLAALNAFSDKAAAAGWAMVCFSGHGLEGAGSNYLVPVDAQLRAARDVPDEAISLDRMLDSLALARTLRLVVLDACRDNPFQARMARTAATPLVSRGLAPVAPGPAFVAFAAASGQTALDGDAADSPFTPALVRRMATPGPGDEHAVPPRRRRRGAGHRPPATGNRQEPVTYGRLPPRGLFFLAPEGAPVRISR